MKGADPNYRVDFFAVRFRNNVNGFAAGAACAPDTKFSDLDTCTRYPSIWRYSEVQGVGEWTEVLGPDRTRQGEPGYVYETVPGYIGALAYMPDGNVLAVGGDTTPSESCPDSQDAPDCGGYPHREPAPGAPDGAGSARAFLYDGSSWQELHDLPSITDADGTDAPMGALTALDCSPRPVEGDFCVAGGLRQLWMFRDGSFDDFYAPTTQSPGKAAVDDGAGWRFRVRSIRFTPGESMSFSEAGSAEVLAVTSGCCDASKASDVARLLVYERGSWWARLLNDYPATGGSSTVRDAHPTESLPDSYYALPTTSNPGSTALPNSVIATPGGPSSEYMTAGQSTEPASRIAGLPDPDGNAMASEEANHPNPLSLASSPTNSVSAVSRGCWGAATGSCNDDTGNLTAEAANPNLSGVRLLAGDGDSGSPSQSFPVSVPPELSPSPPSSSTSPDRIMDWAVGELDATGQAVAYTTLQRGTLTPNPLSCPGDTSLTNPNTRCQPQSSDSLTAQTQSQSLFALPTYALNSFSFTPSQGVGWAVGDKGAIMRLGGAGTAVAGVIGEANPPQLGASQPTALPDRSAYDAYRSAPADQAGPVPPLASMRLEPLSPPRLVPGGAPDAFGAGEVSSIVMSRDGSEGWAVGQPYGSASALLHYADGRWTHCDPDGVPGALAPDPACASLAPLLGAGANRHIWVIARVPTENGSDPSRAGAFEALAIMSGGVVIRYNDGRWFRDGAAARGLPDIGLLQPYDLAFTSPSDGWVVGVDGAGAALLHFDGTQWVDCNPSHGDPRVGECGDPNNLLPFTSGTSFHLSAARGRIYLGANRNSGRSTQTASANYPVILYKDTGGSWSSDASGGGYDPGGPGAAGGPTGNLKAISVVKASGDGYVGWAAGSFGTGAAPLLRLTDKTWSDYSQPDASADYLVGADAHRLATLDGDGRAIALALGAGGLPSHPLIDFDPQRGRWVVSPAGFVDSPTDSVSGQISAGALEAIAPDGQGGAWTAAEQDYGAILPQSRDGKGSGQGPFFFHYADRAPVPVFADVPQPIREQITATAGAPDGSLWVATASSVLYRYDRVTGWDRIAVPGWDPGKATAPSPAYAVAIGQNDEGLVVGKGGRIGDLSPARAVLDAAAGHSLCSVSNVDPCGTSRNLRAAAVAPDGSALVGGDDLALLWRPAGGQFRAIARPPARVSATITGIAMPSADRAWLVTDTGEVLSGAASGSSWSWSVEDTNAAGDLLSRDPAGRPLALRAIALDGAGRGYAVGDHGLVLQRTGDGPEPWRRVATGFADDFDSVALSSATGPGALIGGDAGIVLTLVDGRFEVARPSNLYDPLVTAAGTAVAGAIVGVALLPGDQPGSVEAWAAEQASGGRFPYPGAMLHYTNAPEDPLLHEDRARPLPDAPASQPNEFVLAAFGDSACQIGSPVHCPEPLGSGLANEVIAGQVVDRIVAEAKGSAGPALGLFTGDVDQVSGANSAWQPSPAGADTPVDASIVHHRWVELVAQRFGDAGVPLFGAIGGQDLSQTQACSSAEFCASSRQAGGGLTLPWRQALAGMPLPWGAPQVNGAPNGPAPDFHGFAFVPVSDQSQPAPSGGAATHYALDVERGGTPLLRLVVVDTAQKTLAAGGGDENPLEEQLTWLKDVLSNRPSGERAIVVSNTPTYSYGPGATSDTLTDATTFETILMQNKVDLVVSGRLGWNGRYWAMAPGLHTPCPGGAYADQPPADSTKLCQAPAAAGPDPNAASAQLSAALKGLGAPPPPPDPTGISGQTGLAPLPFVVAASAGGPFGPAGSDSGTASDGYWHGYTEVRISADGKFAPIVEQRPVFDWLSLTAPAHMLAPGQHMTLKGQGREPVGTDQPIRYDDIQSPAITHRYDLLEADSTQPWLPKQDADGNYIPLDPTVAYVDSQTGKVQTGKGQHGRVYAIGLLSVGKKAATWPLVFEPRRSYVPKPPNIVTAPIPPAIHEPPLKLLGASAESLPSTPPPTPPVTPTVANLNFPSPPALPSLPPPAATPVNPPAPPAPPPPPAQNPPSGLNLLAKPVGLNVAPQTSPIPPPSPPINPAPPGGARKEARQRQAAAAKSEEGGNTEGAPGEGGADSGDSLGRVSGINVPNATPSTRLGGFGGGTHPLAPPPAQMTRRDRVRPGVSITPLAERVQPSAWSRDVLYGGGLAIMGLTLALGWATARPTPRRREPRLPAPAWAKPRYRR